MSFKNSYPKLEILPYVSKKENLRYELLRTTATSGNLLGSLVIEDPWTVWCSHLGFQSEYRRISKAFCKEESGMRIEASVF